MRKFIRTGYGEADGVLVSVRQLICIAGEALLDSQACGLLVVVVGNRHYAIVVIIKGNCAAKWIIRLGYYVAFRGGRQSFSYSVCAKR